MYALPLMTLAWVALQSPVPGQGLHRGSATGRLSWDAYRHSICWLTLITTSTTVLEVSPTMPTFKIDLITCVPN